MTRKLLLFIFCALSLEVYSQRTLLAGMQFDFGAPVNSYSLQRSVLGSRILSNHFQGAFSVQARFWDRIGIEAGISQNFQHWRMKDKDFAKRNKGFEVNLRNNYAYYSFFGNLQIYQKLSDQTFAYIEGGYFMNKVGKGSLSETRVFERGSENVSTTSVYEPDNTSVSTGIGIQRFIGDRHMIGFGIRLNMGLDKMMEGSYLVTKSGSAIVEDSYTSKGSFVGINARYSFVIAHRDKKIRTPKPPKPVKEPPVEKKPDPIVTVPKDTDPKANIPKEVEGREVTVTHIVNVARKKVIIKVWDHQKIDGDRISLNLNGRWILINYTLQKQQRVIEVELEEGSNVFVLHALNLGKYEPNTAAIIIDDGIKENKVVLESTMKTSGTIQINCTSK